MSAPNSGSRSTTVSPSTRSALITGASTGIGRATALALDAAGWRVFAGVRREADAAALRAEASARLEPVLLDVTDAGQITAIGAQLDARLGPAGLDALVNNAGIATAGVLEAISAERLREQLEINVVGVHALTRELLPLLRRARGRVVTVGSVSGRMAAPMLGAYAMSKFAIEAWSDALRVEVRPQGIAVSLIQPGPIATPLWAKSMKPLAVPRADGEKGEAAQGLYRPLETAVQNFVVKAEASALPAERVVAAILHALESPRPRARYPIGLAARLRIWVAGVVPDGVRDWLIRGALGL